MSASKGEHASEDGSFQRSAGGAFARGLGLIAVAVGLGWVLLNESDGDDPFVPAAAVGADDEDDSTPPTTEPPELETETDDLAPEQEPTTTTPPVTEAPAVRPPGEVTVQVANGGQGLAGLGSRLTALAEGAGYRTTAPDDGFVVPESRVFFTPGYEAEARAVAELFDPAPAVEALPDPIPTEDADLQGANVLVLATADIADG